jgi:hypothetical protein
VKPVEITVPLEHLPGVTDSGTRRLLKHAAFDAPWSCGATEGETFVRLASIDLAVEVRGGTYILRGEVFTSVLLAALGFEGPPLVIRLPNGRTVYGAELDAREGVREFLRDQEWRDRLQYMRVVNHALLNTWRVGVPVGARVALRERTDGPEVLITRTCSRAWPTGDGTPLVLVEGKHGGWSVACLRPLADGDDVLRAPLSEARAPDVDPPPVGKAPEGSP